jgi:hypothetical protein
MAVIKTTSLDGYVTIKFERTDGTYTLVDAIVVTDAEYAKLTPADIEAMEQKRFDDWYAIVIASQEDEPAVEEQPSEE